MVALTSLRRSALFISALIGQLAAAPVQQDERDVQLLEKRRLVEVTTSIILFSTSTTQVVSSTKTQRVTELSTVLVPTKTIVTTELTSSTSTSVPSSATKKTTSTAISSVKSTPKSTPTSSAVKTTAKTTAKSSANTTVKSVAQTTLKKTTSSTPSSKKSSTSTKKATASSATKKSTPSSSSSKKKSSSVKLVTVTDTVVPHSLSTALFPSSVRTTAATVKPWSSIAPKGNPTRITTLSSGIVAPTGKPSPVNPNAPSATLSLNVVNNGNYSNMHGYLTGLDSNGRFVMLANDGSFYYPTASSGVPEKITGDVALPLSNGHNSFIVPDYIQSARLWFSNGNLVFSAVQTANGVGLVEPTVTNLNDPSEDVSWGFMELNYDYESGLFANLSFVDFVGIPVGMSMTTGGSGTQAAPGMPQGAVEKICGLLKNQTSQDGQPWGSLCQTDGNGHPLRVLSPSSYLASHPNAFSGYFDNYAQKVWDHYSSTPLTIVTQTTAGNVSCQVSGETLTCDGDNRGYQKPTASDVFGCNTGPFSVESGDNAIHLAVVPRLCAAFNRGTLLIPGGNVQPAVPPRDYYTTLPNNFYSAVVHSVEINGQGYAFPYDDVTPRYNQGVAGVVAALNVKELRVALGG